KVAPLIPQLEKAGYTMLYGMNDFNKVKSGKNKLILMNNQGTSPVSLKFAIDQEANDMNLANITEAAIKTLSQGNQGFFLMVEGGKIDWACHANDGAAAIQEVLDFNKAVQKAYDFYQKHPEETLIIVTADHETGGMGVGNGGSTLRINNIKNQKISQEALSTKINELREKNNSASWEQVKALLSEQTGLWNN